MIHLAHAHNNWLVGLSILIAILVSYVALDLAGRITAARGRVQYAWLTGGGIAMGVGIWSMHFIAMLAFQLPIPITYDIPTVIISLLAAIFASGLALLIVSRPTMGWVRVLLGGVVMGVAIAGMHYIGMEAVRVKATLQYDQFYYTLSIVIAIGASIVALWLAFRLRTSSGRLAQLLKVMSAVIMGAAISGMHYTGMIAANFTPANDFPLDPTGSVEVSQLGIAAIAVGTLVLLTLSLLISFVDQRQARLTYPRKFTLISLLFILPLTGFLPIISAQTARLDQYGYKELYGALYLRALQLLVDDIHTHELTIIDLHQGDTSPDEVLAIEARIESDFEALRAVHEQYGRQLQLSTEADDLWAGWQIVQENVLILDEANRHAQYTRFLTNIQVLVSRVGDTSSLILDPELDTYYVMDAVLLKLPESQSLLLETSVLGEAIVNRQAITTNERTQLIILVGRLEANLQATETNIEVAFQNDSSGDLQALLDPPFQVSSNAMKDFLEFLKSRIINAPVIQASNRNEEFLPLAKQALATNAVFYGVASQTLELGIRERIDTLTNQLAIAGAVAIIGIGVAFVAGLNLMLAISRPLVALTEAAGSLATGHLNTRVLVDSTDEAGQLGVAFNNMAQEIQTSQATLAARTRDLSLAADVARSISQVRRLDTLLDDAVELIRSRFNLYYAQIYLLDADKTALNMTAGTGIVGAELKQRKFRLPIGPGSINGTVAAEKRPTLVPDTTKSIIFRPNPLLPDTRSEAAIPVMIGDQVLAVLDMQSAQAGTFTPENLPAFEILAGQLAVAIENATLFDRAEKIRMEIEEQFGRLTRTGWDDYLNAVDRSEQISYSYEAEQTQPADGALTASDPPADMHLLSVPITITGEAVGTLRLESRARSWTEGEAGLVEVVAKRVAQQIENIRLLEQAEQYQREAQDATKRLTRESWEQFLKITDTGMAYIYDGSDVVPAPTTAPHNDTDLIQPITIYGEAVGELAVEGVDASNSEALALLTSVATQLSTHIENLRLNEQTKVTLAETRTLYETSARLNAAQSLEEALHVAAAPAITAGAANALLFVFDLDSNGNPEWMEVRANWAREGAVALPIGVRFYIPTYPLAQLWVNQPDSPAFIDDLQHDPRVDDRLRGVAMQTDMHAYVAMPLIIGGRWVGLISITWTTPHRFPASDAQLYKSLAAQAAAVIDNRLLFAQTQTALAESRHLYEASRRLAAAGSLQEVLATVVESIPIAALNRALIFAYQRDMTGNFSGALVNANWYGGYGTEPTPVGQFYPFESFKTFKIFLNAEPAFFDDGQTDPRIEPVTRDFLAEQHIRGLGILPLWVSGRQLGVMAIACEQPHHFTENEIRPYTSLAQQMAIAVENRRLFQQMQMALSETEELYRASARLNAATTPQETLQAIAQPAFQSQATGGFLYTLILDAVGHPEAIEVLAAIDPHSDPIPSLAGVRFMVADFAYMGRWPRDPSEPFIVANLFTDPRLTDQDRQLMPDTGAFVTLVLKLGDRWVGLVNLSWPEPRSFSDTDIRLYRSLAAQAATLVDGQLLFRQTQKRAERESVINLIAQKIQSATSVEGAIQTAVRELGQAFKARRVVVELGNGEPPKNGN